MTIDEFIERLRETPREGWKLGHIIGDTIRREAPGGVYECPISAVSGFSEDIASPCQAGRRLGLSYTDAKAIVNAADDVYQHDVALRSRLLEACGL